MFGVPYSAAQAQNSCAEVIDQLDRETKAFNEEARKQNAEFLIDEGVDAAIADAGSLLKKATAPSLDGAAATKTGPRAGTPCAHPRCPQDPSLS